MGGMKRVLYLGWDGSYVLSRNRLYRRRSGDREYLIPDRLAGLLDLGGIGVAAGCSLFGGLKLKMFEVVRMEITTRSTATRRRGKP